MPIRLPPQLFNCLIRTHHITSRKKVQRVRRAASQLNVGWVLIRYGGAPGIMFGESVDETSLVEWVASVHDLRYKDFRCAIKPGPSPAVTASGDAKLLAAGFTETESIAEFARQMEIRGLTGWWKQGRRPKPKPLENHAIWAVPDIEEGQLYCGAHHYEGDPESSGAWES